MWRRPPPAVRSSKARQPLSTLRTHPSLQFRSDKEFLRRIVILDAQQELQFCRGGLSVGAGIDRRNQAVSGWKGILRLGAIDFYESDVIVPYCMYTYVRINAKYTHMLHLQAI